jgi:hypothetical protein
MTLFHSLFFRLSPREARRSKFRRNTIRILVRVLRGWKSWNEAKFVHRGAGTYLLSYIDQHLRGQLLSSCGPSRQSLLSYDNPKMENAYTCDTTSSTSSATIPRLGYLIKPQHFYCCRQYPAVLQSLCCTMNSSTVCRTQHCYKYLYYNWTSTCTCTR